MYIVRTTGTILPTCDGLMVTVVGQTKLTTLAAVDVRPSSRPWPAYHCHTERPALYSAMRARHRVARVLLRHANNYSTTVWLRNIAINLCVCPRTYLWNRWSDLHQIFAHVRARGRGSVLLWRRCDTLCTFGFEDDVTFGRMAYFNTRAEFVFYECLVVCECFSVLAKRLSRKSVSKMTNFVSNGT